MTMFSRILITLLALVFVASCADGGSSNVDASENLEIQNSDLFCSATTQCLFVTSDTSGSGDGSSWASPAPGLQAALDKAEELLRVTNNKSSSQIQILLDIVKDLLDAIHLFAATHDKSSKVRIRILLKAGIYRPSKNEDGSACAMDASYPQCTFVMQNNVEIYGGFAGTETSLADRTLNAANTTYLDGLINPSATIKDCSDTARARCSRNVITNDYSPNYPLTASAILDGVVVRNGRTRHFGGGMINTGASPTISNVIFSGNSAAFGGGMYNQWHSSPQLTNVTFSGNSATAGSGYWVGRTFYPDPSSKKVGGGGGMYNHSSSPRLTNVIFSKNSGLYGGGMYNYDSSPQLTNVTFLRNSAFVGGGMCNSRSSPQLTDVTFSGNSAVGKKDGKESAGGGMTNYESSSPLLINVTFSGNSGGYGGGVYNHGSSSPLLINVTFSRNSATYGGGGVFNRDSSLVLVNTLVRDGRIANNDGSHTSYTNDGSLNSYYTAYFSFIEDMAADTSKGNLNGVGRTTSEIFAGTFALADNGNPLAQTVALASNSPAIGAGALIWKSGNDYYASKGTTAYKLENTGVTAATLPKDAKLIPSGANKNNTVTPSNTPPVYPDIGAYQH